MGKNDLSAKLEKLIGEKDALLRRKVTLETRRWKLRASTEASARAELAQIETDLADAQTAQIDLEEKIEQTRAAIDETAAAERQAQLDALRKRERQALKSVIKCATQLSGALVEARQVASELQQQNEGSRVQIPDGLCRAVDSALAQWQSNPIFFD